MKQIIIATILVLGFIVLVSIYVNDVNDVGLGAVDISSSNNVENSSSTVGTSAVEVFGNRTGAVARNISVDGASDIYCSYSSTSTGVIAKEGILIKASSTEWFTLNKGNLWPGSMWCLTESGTSILETIEIY